MCASVAFATPPARSDSIGLGHAWFSQDQIITYCVEDHTFDQYSNISSALWTQLYWWTDEFNEGEEDFKLFLKQLNLKEELGPRFPPRANYRHNKECKGNEDLTLYYGIENARVRKAMAKYNRPLAFAELETFDETTGHGKGFIWISAEAKILHRTESPFHTLLQHEVGHVFGCDHVEKTVMDADIAAFTLAPDDRSIHKLLYGDNKIYFNVKDASVKEINISKSSPIANSLASEIMRKPFSAVGWYAILRIGHLRGNFDGSVEFGELTLYERCFENCFWYEFKRIMGADQEMFPAKEVKIADKLKISFLSRNYFIAHQSRIFRRKYRGRFFSRPILGVVQYGILSEQISEYDAGMRRKRDDLRSFPVIVIRNIHGGIELYLIKGGVKYRLL